jgi:hypothetical protein
MLTKPFGRAAMETTSEDLQMPIVPVFGVKHVHLSQKGVEKHPFHREANKTRRYWKGLYLKCLIALRFA